MKSVRKGNVLEVSIQSFYLNIHIGIRKGNVLEVSIQSFYLNIHIGIRKGNVLEVSIQSFYLNMTKYLNLDQNNKTIDSLIFLPMLTEIPSGLLLGFRVYLVKFLPGNPWF